MSVSKRFSSFLQNLRLTDTQKSDGGTKRESVVRALNAHYYGSSSGTANSIYVGSWAKRTRIRPPRDVDVLFELPASVHTRFEQRVGNRQSQLLQEVRSVLSNTFTSTSIRGDGPVVLVPFASYSVELIPAFRLTNSKFWVCMTDSGGHYKFADYNAEFNVISSSNNATNGNTRDLIRMMKRWQSHCSVPLKSFFIELTAINFIASWGNRGKSALYYDYMVRDFLAYLLGVQNTYVYAPGTGEAMNLGSAWASKAQTAYDRAKKACEYEAAQKSADAGDEWQKIFGTDIPKYV